MIIVDTALAKREAEGRPVTVGMIGAGFMARGIANQIVNSVPGMELVAISNRHLEGSQRAYEEAGVEHTTTVDGVTALEDAIARGVPAVTDDATLPCQAEGIEALLEVTGSVEFGAELNAENRSMMYVPRGCAHGFITLTDDAEALYLVSAFYAPERERGLRYDDPWLGIEWPIDPVELSAKEESWLAFDSYYHGVKQMCGLLGSE